MLKSAHCCIKVLVDRIHITAMYNFIDYDQIPTHYEEQDCRRTEDEPEREKVQEDQLS